MRVLIVLLLVCLPISLIAQISTDRPNASVGAGLVPSTQIQLEAGFQRTQLDAAGGRSEIQIPNSIFRLGLKGIEFRLAMNYLSTSDSSTKYTGFSNMEIGTKIKLLTKSTHLLSYYLQVLTPTGNTGVTTRDWGIDTRLCYEYQKEQHNILGNIGYVQSPGTQSGGMLWTLAYTYSISPAMSTYAEIYGDLVQNKWSTYTDAGLLYKIVPNIQVDFYFGTGIDVAEAYMGIGIAMLSHKTSRPEPRTSSDTRF